MSLNFDRLTIRNRRVRGVLVAALALGSVFATVPLAQAQNLATPKTPDKITPEAGNRAFLVSNAEGTQGYVCLPTGPGAATASWTINGARPEATLFKRFFGQDVQIITHFLSPNTNPNDLAPRPLAFGNATWQSSFDTSKVWATVLGDAVIPAGSDDSCPNAGSIACLLLTAIGTEKGPAGGTILSRTTFIQRLNTKGGSAPDEGCFLAADVGKQALVPYTADYVFFTKGK
jgi:hypothetical protein